MSQEDKDLLLKDLSARLPYGVKFLRESWIYEWDQELSVIEVLEDIDKDGYINNTKVYTVEDIKPYLRSMSSMTEDEREELEHLSEEYFGKALDKQIQESLSSSNRNESEILEYIASSVIVDWLNAHHFDYRGLIGKGLALEPKEGMYK